MKHQFSITLPLIALLLPLLTAGANAQQAGTTTNPDPWADLPHGEAADDLQLRLEIGPNTENITATESLLLLGVYIRNLSQEPKYIDLEQATYNFDYQIDGTWYAFERMDAVPTQRSTIESVRKLVQKIDAEGFKSTHLVLPLADLSPALRLRPIDQGAADRYFEPTPGPHEIRVRPRASLMDGRAIPVSNAITMTFRTPARTATRDQTLSFVPPDDAQFRELRFAGGPADGQALLRKVLARPPNPQNAPRLFSTPVLESYGPLPYYEMRLPRVRQSLDPVLPTELRHFYYPLRAADGMIGYILMEPTPGMSTFLGMNGLDNYHGQNAEFRALRELQRLAGMSELRGRDYEPRLLRVIGLQGSPPLLVYWLHASGRRDLFYRPEDPEASGWAQLEAGRLYSLGDFVDAVQALPVKPRHDEKWAVNAALPCAEKAADAINDFISPDKAQVQIEVSQEQDHVVWYVVIPGVVRRGISPELGHEWLVDDLDGSCRPAGRAFD